MTSKDVFHVRLNAAGRLASQRFQNQMKLALLLAASITAACLDSDFSCLKDTNVAELNNQLCTQMKGMPGCSLRAACKTDRTKPYCHENIIYAIMCQDMPMMKACQPFQQCTNVGRCDLVPKTVNTTQQIFSICNEMSMEGCNKCAVKESSIYAECDLVQTYSDLCLAMPKMSQCNLYDQMCNTTKDLPYCKSLNSDSNQIPKMQMFFHSAVSDYILFENWVPRTTGQYVLAWVLVFLSAVFYEALQVYAQILELHWVDTSKESEPILSTAFGDLPEKHRSTMGVQNICGISSGIQGVKQSFFRSLLRVVSTMVGYVLMLIAMTFNIGLFFAIIAGFGTGTFVFVPIIRNKSK